MAEGCRYDDAGPWDGGAHCSGTFYPGTEALGEYLVGRFGGSYGGYSCRPNTADTDKLSVHGTGRAVDYFPPTRAIGDQVAELATASHEAWGIQLAIWWMHDWECDQGWNDYGGPNPHTDHVHLELTIPAANNNTAATYGGEPEEDIDIVDDKTKAYFDAKFATIRERDEAALQRDRADRRRDLVVLRELRAVRAAQGASRADLAEIDEQLDAIEALIKADAEAPASTP